jgi:hypothetical protein
MIVSRKYFEEKLNGFCALFFKSFKRDVPKSFFEWRYLNNPFKEILAAFEMDGMELVGNYSACPCLLGHDTKEYKSAMSMTTMTDPAYFGRGIFTKLAKELYLHMLASGYALIWGFPNADSHPGFKNKLYWIDIYEIPTMILDLNKLRKTNKSAENAVFRDDSFSLDYSSTQNYDDCIHVKKNRAYLKWRYLFNPQHEYKNYVLKYKNKVVSYCVFKVYQSNSIDIVDFQAKNQADASDLIYTIIERAKQTNMHCINAWVPIHFFTHDIFEKMGFINGAPITYFGAMNLRKSNSDLPVADYSRWYIQMGDSDVY